MTVYLKNKCTYNYCSSCSFWVKYYLALKYSGVIITFVCLMQVFLDQKQLLFIYFKLIRNTDYKLTGADAGGYHWNFVFYILIQRVQKAPVRGKLEF